MAADGPLSSHSLIYPPPSSLPVPFVLSPFLRHSLTPGFREASLHQGRSPSRHWAAAQGPKLLHRRVSPTANSTGTSPFAPPSLFASRLPAATPPSLPLTCLTRRSVPLCWNAPTSLAPAPTAPASGPLPRRSCSVQARVHPAGREARLHGSCVRHEQPDLGAGVSAAEGVAAGGWKESSGQRTAGGIETWSLGQDPWSSWIHNRSSGRETRDGDGRRVAPNLYRRQGTPSSS